MKTLTPTLTTALIALAATAQSSAALLPGYDAGTGGSTAHLVIDFGFLGGDAYQFDYHYDGPATAEQMLLDLDAAGDLEVDHQFFNFGGVDSIFINGFSFEGLSAVPGFEGDAGENWSYWISDDTLAVPFGWSGASFGPTDRVLEDGSYDGWALNVSEFNTGGFTPTNDPPASVPEPAGVLLIGVAGFLLTRRRR